MAPSAALFIDGSNFYHALKEDERLPFDYGGFFAQLSKKFDLKSIYFYDAFKNMNLDPEGYAKQQEFHHRLKSLKTVCPITIRTRTLRYLANMTHEKVENAAKEVGIVDACKKKLWALLMRLKLIRLTKEKGVDVLMVVDAIEKARTKEYDVIILLTGDADFVPAVDLIKSFGVRTINAHTYGGSAKELRDACGEHILVDFEDDTLVLRQFSSNKPVQ